MGLEVGPFTFSKKEKPGVENIKRNTDGIRGDLKTLDDFTKGIEVTSSIKTVIDQAIKDIHDRLNKIESEVGKL